MLLNMEYEGAVNQPSIDILLRKNGRFTEVTSILRTEGVNRMYSMENAIFTNMCMICDKKGNVVVQERAARSWSDIAFPGGHVDLLPLGWSERFWKKPD